MGYSKNPKFVFVTLASSQHYFFYYFSKGVSIICCTNLQNLKSGALKDGLFRRNSIYNSFHGIFTSKKAPFSGFISFLIINRSPSSIFHTLSIKMMRETLELSLAVCVIGIVLPRMFRYQFFFIHCNPHHE